MILPPWCRTSPKVAEVLPLLYLHGLSTGDFVPALAAFFGSSAGLSAAAITRLVAAWQGEYETFCRRDLADRDYVYMWCDGVHFRVRLEQARLCCLVIVGVRADGRKELVAVCDGERESTLAWAELLRDLRRRERVRVTLEGGNSGGGGNGLLGGAVGDVERRFDRPEVLGPVVAKGGGKVGRRPLGPRRSRWR